MCFLMRMCVTHYKHFVVLQIIQYIVYLVYIHIVVVGICSGFVIATRGISQV